MTGINLSHVLSLRNDPLISFHIPIAFLLLRWTYEVADPMVRANLLLDPDTVYIPSDACLEMSVPFKAVQCRELMNSQPFNLCPWQDFARNPTGSDHFLTCFDGTTCDTRLSHACCNSRQGRKFCPPNTPFMCATPLACAGNYDYCCKFERDMCDDGERACPPLWSQSLPEYEGILPEERQASYKQYLDSKFCFLILFLIYNSSFTITHSNSHRQVRTGSEVSTVSALTELPSFDARSISRFSHSSPHKVA